LKFTETLSVPIYRIPQKERKTEKQSSSPAQVTEEAASIGISTKKNHPTQACEGISSKSRILPDSPPKTEPRDSIQHKKERRWYVPEAAKRDVKQRATRMRNHSIEIAGGSKPKLGCEHHHARFRVARTDRETPELRSRVAMQNNDKSSPYPFIPCTAGICINRPDLLSRFYCREYTYHSDTLKRIFSV